MAAGLNDMLADLIISNMHLSDSDSDEENRENERELLGAPVKEEDGECVTGQLKPERSVAETKRAQPNCVARTNQGQSQSQGDVAVLGIPVGVGGLPMLPIEDDNQVQPPEIFRYPTACGFPYFHLSQFPSMAILHHNWLTIRDEAVCAHGESPVLEQHRPGEAWGDRDSTFQSFVEMIATTEGWHCGPKAEGEGPNTDWLNFGLVYNGQQLPANCKKCPKTASLLSGLPIRVAGFSLLRPSSALEPHRDATGIPYNSLAYHLGLVVPRGGNCTLTVNGIPHAEVNGAPLIFDSSYTHTACNTTQEDRIILYIDFSVVVHPNGLVHELSDLCSESVKDAANGNLPPDLSSLYGL